MGPNLKIFEKSQKCRGKKIFFFPEPVLLYTSFAHQCSCNIFFLQEYFFLGDSWEKYVLAPPTTPATPGYPGFRVTRQAALFLMVPVSIWAEERCSGARYSGGLRFLQSRSKSIKYFFLGCRGVVVGDFFLSLAKNGSKFGKRQKIPKMSSFCF
jgi:hypothetical protein